MREITPVRHAGLVRLRAESAGLRLRHLRPVHRPGRAIDIRSGLAATPRLPWILERGDTEELAGPTSAYGQARLADPRWPSCASTCTASRAARAAGRNVTQMHYARQGIITPEMEFVAIRENLRRQEYLES
jgi:phosphomethylpyrimidine synthase